MKRNQIIMLSLFAALLLGACEMTIHPALQQADPQYIVDAFVTDKLDTQVIKIMFSQPYFEAQLPPPVSGATVEITDNEGNIFVFPENPLQKGSYTWIPSGTGFGKVGNSYFLSVKVNGESFVSTSKMGRVPPIDSISFKKDTDRNDNREFYRGQFWAEDPLGPGDTYWIKAWKNGVPLLKPGEITLAYDAAFSKGSNFDGYTFIQPIRNGINPQDPDPNNSNQMLSPYMPGDSVYVEIHSLTEATFDFMTQVQVQTDRPGGFAELFSRPIANVSTNITNETAGGTKVQGFFNVGSVSGLGKRFSK